MSFVDCHCHLYALAGAETAILRARDAGVTKAVVVSEDKPSMEQTLRLRDDFPEFVLPGLGIHPVNVFSMSPEEWESAFSFLKSHAHEASCIGEIGLDFKCATTEKEQEEQRNALHAQMEVAADNHKPINLHSRRALRQTMEEAIAFHRNTGLPVLLHWFAHSEKLLTRTNREGIFVSVGPSILFSGEALDLAYAIDPQLILVETDTPVPFKGTASSPDWAAKVAERLIARHPRKSLSSQRLFDNAQRFLGRL